MKSMVSKDQMRWHILSWIVPLLMVLSACQSNADKGSILFTQSQSPTKPESGVTMLPGFEFAQKLQTNVVTLWIEEHGESGTGFIVGRREDDLYLVTAGHVVDLSNKDDALEKAMEIEVTFCADPAPALTALAEIVWRSSEQDLAVLRVKDRIGISPLIKVLAPVDTVLAGERVWFIGKGDKCVVPPNEGKILETKGFDNRLIIDAPIVGGGSSGAPAVTGFGIMGMLLEDVGLRRNRRSSNSKGSGLNSYQRIKVLDIGRIREMVTAEANIPWMLYNALNLPPDSRQAARHNITTILNDYLFNLQNVHEYFNQGWNQPDELRRIIPKYNRAYGKYYRERTVNRAAVATNWGDSAESRFVQIQKKIHEIHSEVLSLNTYRIQMYDTEPSLPDEALKIIEIIKPKIGVLMEDFSAFQLLLSR